MKKILNCSIVFLAMLGLVGCLASTNSPNGVNCDFSKEKPLWEMNPDCVGGR